ncbi:MAG: hypothetical protein V1818_04720 [Candidatus Aenigmatarchaeota archaeon]
MNLSKLFFLVTAFTLFLTVVQLFGYWVLELLIIMLIIDFLTLTASVQLGSRNHPKGNPNGKDVATKLDAIDKRCTEIFDKVNNSTLETKLQKHGEDITYILDKMARKTMDLEEKIIKFGNGMVDSMAGLKEKVNDIETKKDGDSFSLGELVYVKDEEDS